MAVDSAAVASAVDVAAVAVVDRAKVKAKVRVKARVRVRHNKEGRASKDNRDSRARASSKVKMDRTGSKTRASKTRDSKTKARMVATTTTTPTPVATTVCDDCDIFLLREASLLEDHGMLTFPQTVLTVWTPMPSRTARHLMDRKQVRKPARPLPSLMTTTSSTSAPARP